MAHTLTRVCAHVNHTAGHIHTHLRRLQRACDIPAVEDEAEEGDGLVDTPLKETRTHTHSQGEGEGDADSVAAQLTSRVHALLATAGMCPFLCVRGACVYGVREFVSSMMLQGCLCTVQALAGWVACVGVCA